MMYAIQWIRSLIYVGHVYLMMPVVAIAFAPWALFSRKGAQMACHTWANWAVWSLGWMTGLKTEVRGTPPTDEVLIAAKHQSFLDIILIYKSIPAGKFIMKKEILYTPFIGLYGMRIGCIAVDRGKRSEAIKKMVKDVAAGNQDPGQLIIYSQGTRIAPGVKAPYKIGTGVLYKEMNQDCVPVATNVGLFWPKKGIMRKQGLAVVEFLPPIKAGKELDPFMEELEEVVESNSNRLMREAGFEIN